MTTLAKGHYHCIECGKLFEAEVIDVREQRCPICGNPPTGKILAGTEEDLEGVSSMKQKTLQAGNAPELHGVSQDAKEIYEATVKARSKKSRGKVRRTKRKPKKRKKIIVLIALWLGLMVAIVMVVKHFSPAEEETVAQMGGVDDRDNLLKDLQEQKKRSLVQAALPKCEQAMMAFLNAPSAAAKSQQVYEGVKLSGVMARYYRNNPSFSSTRGLIKITWADVLDFEGKKVIGAIGRNSLGEKFEVIFVKSGDEWQIDWLSFVRHDTRPWSLFQTGSDGDEGVFRLYMRVRDTNKDLERKEMSVVFYKPKIYSKGEYEGLASSPVVIQLNSPLGLKIKKLIDREDEAADGKGYPIGDLDPPGYHRVRVKMRLHKKEGVPAEIELLKIIDTHWYGLDQAASEQEL